MHLNCNERLYENRGYGNGDRSVEDCGKPPSVQNQHRFPAVPEGVEGMATERANDLRAFRDFADAKLSSGGVGPTLDEALVLWDVENAPDDERAATVQAVREALADMRAGEAGVSARDFLAELRREFNLPASA